jgi:transcriptional regulator with XRE-family HTH domain
LPTFSPVPRINPESFCGVFVIGGCHADFVKGATNHLTPGEKVAYYRRRRGISQTALAELVGKTTSWIEKIESGRANLQMLPNIANLAEVLDISPFELLPDDIVQVDAATRGRSVPALRKQLLSYRFVNPRYLQDQAEALLVPDLTRAVANVWEAYQASKFGFVIAELHRLLPRALASTRSGTDRDAVVQMAYLYQVASCVLTKVGEADLAFICADRGEQLVQDAGDLAARVSVQRTIAHALLSNAQYDDALAVVDQTLAAVPRGVDSPQLLSALGTTHLVGAMVSARSKDRRTAHEHLHRAQQAADALRVDGNYLWTAFGPTNVAIHEVAVAAELGDYQRAAHLGQRVDASPMPMERQVRHRLEVARALHFQRQQGDAIALVLEAETKAPEQVRRHFMTHTLLHEWIRSRRLFPSPELHGLARRAGILAA